MRLFVIGAEGQVARALREIASQAHDVTFGFGARPDLDVLQPASVAKALAAFGPDLVVNPAAYTAVDRAEIEPEQAFAVNRDGARAVASAAADRGVPLIHLSTDYVFDGKKQEPYSEADPVGPQGVYGRSKLEGERAVAETNPKHIVLRTSWVYAPFGTNFVRTMLRLGAERERLTVVDDQRGCPTYAPDIARAIVAIARMWAASGWDAKYAGVTHLAGPDMRTWCGFAREIVEGAAQRGGRLIPVDPITTSDYPTPATRPANSCLSTQRLQALFGLSLPPLKTSLDDCLDRLLRH
jgi:dTDP-4-dehydrorhamnose reductase